MSRHVRHVNDVEVLPMLRGAMALLWIRLTRAGVRERCAQAMLTVTGYLRPRPARTDESALRAAFAELDRDLAVLLADRAHHPESHR